MQVKEVVGMRDRCISGVLTKNECREVLEVPCTG